MSQSYDAIIIGAGIIGCATSYALGLKGWRVLNIDRLPACGYGSTSGSCAIIRPYYSTLDGSAMAYESHYYWLDWADYLGGADIDEKWWGIIEKEFSSDSEIIEAESTNEEETGNTGKDITVELEESMNLKGN